MNKKRLWRKEEKGQKNKVRKSKRKRENGEECLGESIKTE